jgi:hypothetical protein
LDACWWKTYDANHEEFRNETKNIRFALSKDGMNPFGERSSTHNTWPVILTHLQPSTVALSQTKVPFTDHSYARSKATWHQHRYFSGAFVDRYEEAIGGGGSICGMSTNKSTSHSEPLFLLPSMTILCYFP